MADLSKKNVRGGGLPSAKFDFSSHTFSTTNFGVFMPVKTIRLRAGDSIKGNVHQQSWLDSLPAPVFGKFKNNTRAFFTKFSRIFKHYNDMLSGNKVQDPYTGNFGVVNHVPYISPIDIMGLFVSNSPFLSLGDVQDNITKFELKPTGNSSFEIKLKDNYEMDYYNNPNILCYPVALGDLLPNDAFTAHDFRFNFSRNVQTEGLQEFNPFTDVFSQIPSIVENFGNDIVVGDVEFPHYFTLYRFTRVGKIVFSLLLSLGYRFNLSWDIDNYPDYTFTDDLQEEKYWCLRDLMNGVSILPLLGYVRAYADWVLPSRYYNDSQFIRWRRFEENLNEYGCFNNNDNEADLKRYYPLRSVFTDWLAFADTTFPGIGDMQDCLRDILLIICRSYYTEDYFMSSYSDMVEPGISYPSHLLVDTGEYERGAYANNEGSIEYEEDTAVNRSGSQRFSNPYARGAAANVANNEITQFQLLSVGRLQDMLLSGLIGGTKIQDWLKNEFGITPSKDSMMLTDYLGCDTQPVTIGDIYAQSAGTTPDGNGNYLGEVAGRGIINTGNGFNLDYSTNEDGFLFIVHELVSVPFYYQGLTDDVLETGKYDFYNPRFDGIGFDPISHIEMFNFPIDTRFDSPLINPYGTKVFGWQPTYSRKKIPHDDLLGDFASPARNADLMSWFVSRDFSRSTYLDSSGLHKTMPQVISKAWQSALADANINDFNRIFYTNDGYRDPVRSLFVFNLTKMSHMLPIKESFDFTSGKDSITNSDGSVLNQ